MNPPIVLLSRSWTYELKYASLTNYGYDNDNNQLFEFDNMPSLEILNTFFETRQNRLFKNQITYMIHLYLTSNRKCNWISSLETVLIE